MSIKHTENKAYLKENVNVFMDKIGPVNDIIKDVDLKMAAKLDSGESCL
jgi:hypothetical protein